MDAASTAEQACDYCGKDVDARSEECFAVVCLAKCHHPLDHDVYHSHCLKQYFRSFCRHMDVSRKSGFLCPKGRGRGTEVSYKCTGKISHSSKLFIKEQKAADAAAMPTKHPSNSAPKTAASAASAAAVPRKLPSKAKKPALNNKPVGASRLMQQAEALQPTDAKVDPLGRNAAAAAAANAKAAKKNAKRRQRKQQQDEEQQRDTFARSTSLAGSTAVSRTGATAGLIDADSDTPSSLAGYSSYTTDALGRDSSAAYYTASNESEMLDSFTGYSAYAWVDTDSDDEGWGYGVGTAAAAAGTATAAAAGDHGGNGPDPTVPNDGSSSESAAWHSSNIPMAANSNAVTAAAAAVAWYSSSSSTDYVTTGAAHSAWSSGVMQEGDSRTKDLSANAHASADLSLHDMYSSQQYKSAAAALLSDDLSTVDAYGSQQYNCIAQDPWQYESLTLQVGSPAADLAAGTYKEQYTCDAVTWQYTSPASPAPAVQVSTDLSVKVQRHAQEYCTADPWQYNLTSVQQKHEAKPERQTEHAALATTAAADAALSLNMSPQCNMQQYTYPPSAATATATAVGPLTTLNSISQQQQQQRSYLVPAAAAAGTLMAEHTSTSQQQQQQQQHGYPAPAAATAVASATAAIATTTAQQQQQAAGVIQQQQQQAAGIIHSTPITPDLLAAARGLPVNINSTAAVVQQQLHSTLTSETPAFTSTAAAAAGSLIWPQQQQQQQQTATTVTNQQYMQQQFSLSTHSAAAAASRSVVPAEWMSGTVHPAAATAAAAVVTGSDDATDEELLALLCS